MDFTLYFLGFTFHDLFLAGPVLLFLLMQIGLIGYLIGRIEGWSLMTSFYHAFINATTVGYGDFHPTKKSSRMLAILLALTGVVFTGLVVAIAIHATNLAYSQVHSANLHLEKVATSAHEGQQRH